MLCFGVSWDTCNNACRFERYVSKMTQQSLKSTDVYNLPVLIIVTRDYNVLMLCFVIITKPMSINEII